MSCTITGLRRGGNHSATTRTTLMNDIASPSPISTRATIASRTSVTNANASCPAVMNAAPAASIRREPNRSSSMPTGTCMPAYTASCATENKASSEAPTPKRWAASTPATASEDRWNTAPT